MVLGRRGKQGCRSSWTHEARNSSITLWDSSLMPISLEPAFLLSSSGGSTVRLMGRCDEDAGFIRHGKRPKRARESVAKNPGRRATTDETRLSREGRAVVSRMRVRILGDGQGRVRAALRVQARRCAGLLLHLPHHQRPEGMVAHLCQGATAGRARSPHGEAVEAAGARSARGCSPVER